MGGIEHGVAGGDRWSATMSFRAVLWALKQKLPPTPKLLLVAIASHANKDTNLSFPKVATLAEEASMSRRTAHRHLRTLEGGNYVEIEKKYRGKGRQPSNYKVNCVADDPRPPSDTRYRRSCDTRGTDKKNHYSNHNNRAQQVSETVPGREGRLTPAQSQEQRLQNELAKRLGRDGWDVLTAFPEMVPILTGKLQRGTLKQSDLLDLRARFTLQGGVT